MDPDDILQTLIDANKFYQDHQEDDEGFDIDFDKLWQCLVNISSEDVEMLGKFYPYLTTLVKYDAEFQDENPECVTKLISKFCDAGRASEERKKLMIPLIRLFPFLNMENTVKVVKGLIKLAERLIEKKYEIPNAIIRAFDELVDANISSEITDEIFDTIQTSIGKQKRSGALVILGCFTQLILSSSNKITEIIKITEEAIEGSTLETIAAMFVLEKLGASLAEFEEAIDSKAILNIIVSALCDEHENIRNAAIAAFKSMADSGIFISNSISRLFIREFGNFNQPDLLPTFFDSLRIMVNANIDIESSDDDLEEEEFDEDPEKDNTAEEDIPDDEENNSDDEDTFENVKPIRDFTVSALKASPSNEVLEGCIFTLSDILSLSSALLRESRKDICAKVFKLLDSKTYPLFPALAKFVRSSFENSNLAPTGRLAQRLRLLLHGAKKEEAGDIVKRLYLTCDVAAIARPVRKSLVTPVFNIAFEELKNEDDDIKVLAAMVIGKVGRSLTEQQALDSIKLISDAARKVMSFENFEGLLKELIFVAANKAIREEHVSPLIEDMIAGKIAAFRDCSLQNANPVCVEAFKFIGACVRLGKASKLGGSIASLLLDDPSSEACKYIVDALSVCVEKGSIAGETMKQVAEKASIIFCELSLDNAQDVISISDFLRVAFCRDHKCFDTKTVFKHASEILKDVNETEDEEEDSEDESQEDEAVVALALFVFICFLQDSSLKVNKTLLHNLMKLLVITSDDPHIPPLVTAIIDMFAAGKRFSEVKILSLSTFAQIVSMDSEEIEELDLKEGDKERMIKILKDEVKSSSSIIKQITEDFSDDDEKMQRFNDIIQH